MHYSNTILTVIIIFFINQCLLSQVTDFPDLYGPYFGQQTPGSQLSIFADGIISGNTLHATPVFSPDGNEIYWAQSNSNLTNTNIYVSRIVNNKWTTPEVTSFCGSYHDDNPVFSPNGQRLFFNSHREIDGATKERIWFVDRENDSLWSAPTAVNPVINDQQLHWQIGVDMDGAIYFQTDRLPSYGGGDIFYSEYVDSQFTAPQNMGNVINTNTYESMPYIDRQNEFMLFCRFADIYITERLPEGGWSQPENISIDYPYIRGTCPQITPDGNYLFFTIINNLVSHVYWIDAQFILNDYTGLDQEHADYNTPDDYKLRQNCPNPFNPITTIQYELPQRSDVQITIYDLLGRKVITLLSETQDAGYKSVQWDATNVSSGMYFYQIKADGFIETRKMVLLR